MKLFGHSLYHRIIDQLGKRILEDQLHLNKHPTRQVFIFGQLLLKLTDLRIQHFDVSIHTWLKALLKLLQL